MSRRPLYWLAVLLAAAAVVGGGLVAYSGYRATASATSVVRSYFSALQHGDAADALGLGDVPGLSHAMLTPAVLHAQLATAPIRHVQVTSSSTRGDSGHVAVDYLLDFPGDPQQISDDVPVVRRAGAWRLVNSAVLTSLSLASAKDRADILNAAVPTGAVLMFPGAIPVRFDSPYLQAVARNDYVTFKSGTSVSVQVDVSAAGRAAVVAAVDRALRACLTSAHADPRCPLPDDRYVPGSIRSVHPPHVDKNLDITVEPGAAGLLTVTGDVSVRATYRRLTFANVAVTGSGRITLGLSAETYAVAPIKLVWTKP